MLCGNFMREQRESCPNAQRDIADEALPSAPSPFRLVASDRARTREGGPTPPVLLDLVLGRRFVATCLAFVALACAVWA